MVFVGIAIVLLDGLFDLPVLLFVALCLCCLFRLNVVCVWLMLRVYCVLLFDWFTLCLDVCVVIVFWLVVLLIVLMLLCLYCYVLLLLLWFDV